MARRFFRPRLLPIVMVVGTPLLALKGFGLVRDAQAAENLAAPQATMQDYQASPASDAGDDGASTNNSAAEVGVLTSLAKRRTQLDNEQQAIAMRESLLQATEKRVDDKIAMLKQLQAQIQQLLAQRDSEQEKQIASLVKTYSAMKPKDAARIFNTLDDSVLVPVAQEMKPDVLGPILANMQASQAQKLTVELADRLHVPDPQVTPPEAPPAPQAQAAPSIDPSALAAALAPETAPVAGTTPAAAAPSAASQTAAQPAASKPTPGPQAQATPPAPAAAKPAPGTQAQAPQSAPAQPAAKGG
jgi:flagellar motility protein MotE (MotC chaperone)